MTIRVVRVLEYSFPDLEAAEAHFANSFVPTNGVRVVAGNKVKPMTIRSATTWPEQVEKDEIVSQETTRKIEELKRLTEQARQERVGVFVDDLSPQDMKKSKEFFARHKAGDVEIVIGPPRAGKNRPATRMGGGGDQYALEGILNPPSEDEPEEES